MVFSGEACFLITDSFLLSLIGQHAELTLAVPLPQKPPFRPAFPKGKRGENLLATWREEYGLKFLLIE